jgi:hypothetical protein
MPLKIRLDVSQAKVDPRACAVYTKSNIQIIGNGLVVAQRG